MAEAATNNLAQNTAPMQLRDKLREDLEVRLKMYKQGSKLWSAAYHTLLYSSATLSTAAAMLLKMTSFKDHAQDISAVLAAVSALFSTYIAGGGFSRKWRANRIASGKISQLLIDISDPACDLASVAAAT